MKKNEKKRKKVWWNGMKLYLCVALRKRESNETNGLKSSQKKVEKTFKKVWRYKKELYFCAALRKKRSNETNRF
jgi:hypothetical protein